MRTTKKTGESSNRHEIHQLGFRLAAQLKHRHLYAVDWHGPGPDISDVYRWGQVHQPTLHQELETQMQALSATVRDPRPESKSILDHLRTANEPGRPLQEQEWYMGGFALIGSESEYPGVDWMTGWYRRNMMVYVNVARLVASPDDRILVMFGAGHRYLLQQFFIESGRFALESVQAYLT